MKARRLGRCLRAALPLACAWLAACGPDAPPAPPPSHSARSREDMITVPAASPLRQVLKVGVVAETTVEREAGAGDGAGAPLVLGQHRAFTVPASAVVTAGKASRVFVERAPWVFEPRTVTTGAQVGSQIEIASGLGAGERVVVQGSRLLE